MAENNQDVTADQTVGGDKNRSSAAENNCEADILFARKWLADNKIDPPRQYSGSKRWRIGPSVGSERPWLPWDVFNAMELMSTTYGGNHPVKVYETEASLLVALSQAVRRVEEEKTQELVSRATKWLCTNGHRGPQRYMHNAAKMYGWYWLGETLAGDPWIPNRICVRLTSGTASLDYMSMIKWYKTEKEALRDLGTVLATLELEVATSTPPEPESSPEPKRDQSPSPVVRGPEDQKMFLRTGEEVTHDPLVSFLYDLIRDALPAGKIESLVRNAVVPVTMTNGYIAAYAKDIAARLREIEQ